MGVVGELRAQAAAPVPAIISVQFTRCPVIAEMRNIREKKTDWTGLILPLPNATEGLQKMFLASRSKKIAKKRPSEESLRDLTLWSVGKL